MADKGMRPGHAIPDGIADTPDFRMACFDPAHTGGVHLEFKEFLNSDTVSG